MTSLSLTTTDDVTDAAVDALIIGLHQGAADGDPVRTADPRFSPFASLFEAAGATGKIGDVVRVPSPPYVTAKVLVGAGLGKAAGLGATAVREAAGAVSRALTGLSTAASTLSVLDLAAAAEGHLLGAYQFDRYKTTPKKSPDDILLAVPSADDASRSVLARAQVAAAAVALARDLVNTAPNDLPPARLADRAAELAADAGLEVEILDEHALEAGGYGGILGVGSGSSRPPRLVQVRYSPPNPVATVALVGKGICFDSGGLSIKPAQHMDHMTSDMAGAAAVLAATVAASRLSLPVTVIATIPMAENLPSGHAYRPGDVLRHYGGKTVHVLNTDAEGRLILADALVRAAEDKPDFLVEVSTLTGAQIVALGNRTMGVMGTDDFRDQVATTGRRVGEGAWAMPLPDDLREGLDSPLADLQNISWDRSGGMLRAGLYLREFMPEGVPWAHLDVAGPAHNSIKPWGYTPLGGTGVPVRTLLAVLEDIASA